MEAEGYSGEIWVLWEGEEIEVEIILVHKQFIHLVVNPRKQGEWQLTIIYASPRATERLELWHELGKDLLASPWCVMGDFNATLNEDERMPSGKPSSCFQEWVSSRGLIDLGYNGPKFTWNHERELQHRKSARLDRALVDHN